MGKQYPWRRVLSLREAMVLDARLRGLTVKEVASDLGVSYRAVRHHLEEIHRKLGAHSTQQAVNRLKGGRCAKCLFGYLPRYNGKG